MTENIYDLSNTIRDTYTSYYENIHKMEVIIMTVEKFIRILGYIVYVALWSPVIVLIMVIMPIWMLIKSKSLSFTWMLVKDGLKTGIRHDREFIKTGVWY